MLGGMRDRMVLGPARRRHQLNRRLGAPDRLDAVRPPRRRSRRGTGQVSPLLVTILTAVLLVGIAVLGDPGVVPAPLRSLTLRAGDLSAPAAP